VRRIAKRRLAQALLALVVAFVAPPSVATADGSRELVNPALGEEYRNWALGSISYLLSKKETKEYGQLTNDDQAASFVAAFWAARDAGLRTRYEERAAEGCTSSTGHRRTFVRTLPTPT
jgi:hypothetical protein